MEVVSECLFSPEENDSIEILASKSYLERSLHWSLGHHAQPLLQYLLAFFILACQNLFRSKIITVKGNFVQNLVRKRHVNHRLSVTFDNLWELGNTILLQNIENFDISLLFLV